MRTLAEVDVDIAIIQDRLAAVADNDPQFLMLLSILRIERGLVETMTPGGGE